MDEWIKMRHIFTMEFHLAIKERIMSFAATKMDIEIIILSEVRMTPYQYITYMWNLKNDTNEFIYVEQKQTHTHRRHVGPPWRCSV